MAEKLMVCPQKDCPKYGSDYSRHCQEHYKHQAKQCEETLSCPACIEVEVKDDQTGDALIVGIY